MIGNTVHCMQTLSVELQHQWDKWDKHKLALLTWVVTNDDLTSTDKLTEVSTITTFSNASLYSGTPLNGHPSTADTHDIRDNSGSPDCPSIHFNT